MSRAIDIREGRKLNEAAVTANAAGPAPRWPKHK